MTRIVRLLSLLCLAFSLSLVQACIDPTANDDDDTGADDDDAGPDDDDTSPDDDDTGPDDDDTQPDDDDSASVVDEDGDGSPAGEDCDDQDPNNFPGNTEACDGFDNDCNGLADAGLPGDGGQENDYDGDGQWECQGDCDDLNASVFTGNPEICDGQDNNCDNSLPAEESDEDGDGQMVCDGDCNDEDPANFLGNAEICDGADNDCDGNAGADEVDNDGDNYMVCEGDCDDTANGGSIFPGNVEACNGIDDDCSGSPGSDEVDADNDGFMVCAGDCDDSTSSISPVAPEICDGEDNDCSGGPGADEVDNDGDNYMVCEGDCEDSITAINPGATEVCDGVDNDCSGDIDEGVPNDGNGCTDPGMPSFPATVGNIAITTLTATTPNAPTDNNTLQVCLTSGDCFELDNENYDDFESGAINVFTFEGVNLPRSAIDRFQITSTDGVDAWTPACIEMAVDGELFYCFDNYNETFGENETTSWTDPLGPNNISCDSCYASKLTHGPMVGAMEATEARLWVRTHATKQTALRIATSSGALSSASPVSYAYPDGEDDMTHVFEIGGLASDSTYFYAVDVDGLEEATGQFNTNPTGPTAMTFAFGSCSAQDSQPIFSTIEAEAPDVFFFAGDNHYGNTNHLSDLRQHYRWALEIPERASLATHTATLAVWDDHDFVGNNTNGNALGKDSALDAFTEYWANPFYGTANIDGIFSNWSYGDIEFFLLDDRYWRDIDSNILGSDQQDWLEDALQQSTATFKFILSGSQWSTEGSDDSWAYWPDAQVEFLDWIATEQIDGVVLLSGDVHRSELRILPGGNGGYSLPELTSSPLANSNSSCQPSNELGPDNCYDTDSYFLTVEVNTAISDPSIIVDILDESGALLDSLVIYHSDLDSPSFAPVDPSDQPDFNGDGYADLALGVPYEDIGNQSNAGGALVLIYGSITGLDASTAENWFQDVAGVPGEDETGDWFGYSLASGDFNNDGNDDLAVGAPHEDLGADTEAGSVVVIYGSSNGLDAQGLITSQSFHQDNITSGYSAEDYDHCGESVAAGDFDGDNYDDLVFGCPDEDLVSNNFNSAGTVIVVYGSNTGLDHTSIDTFNQNTSGIGGVLEANDEFGRALAVGDVNGDGRDDLAVGIPFEDTESNGYNNAGRVSVILGSPGGLSAAGADIFDMLDVPTAPGEEAYSYLGFALTSGDYDGDGFDDIAAGAHGYGPNNTGAVVILAGSASGIDLASSTFLAPADSPWPLSYSPQFGYSLSSLDADGDGLDDLAIGMPDLDIGTTIDCGGVTLLRGTPAMPTFTNSQLWHSDLDEVAGSNENSDSMGWALPK